MSDSLWTPYIPPSERETNVYDNAKTTRTANDQLGKEAFLMLLVTQMKYQDPLNPVEDKEFLAQMAQFSALEQMQNLSSTAEKSQAFSMVGKYILANVRNDQTGSYTEVFGRVDFVNMKNGNPYLVVDGKEVGMDDVENVYEDENKLALDQAQKIQQMISQNMSLIGKSVQAIILDDEGNPKEFVEGIVEQVKVGNNTAILVVGGKEILPSEIVSVSENKLLIGNSISYYDSGSVLTDANIVGVDVTGEEPQLVLDNGKKVPISKIGPVSDALKYVGQTVTVNGVTGEVEKVIIKNGAPHFKIGEEILPFSSMKN